MASNESSGSGTSPNPSGSGNLPRGLLSLRGTPVSKDTRLSSLRGTRDLTLGGVKKKTFQPNIPARRNKDENKEQKDVPAETPANTGHQPGHGKKDDRSRIKGHGRGRPDVIQSHSIFEEGPSKTEKCKVSREPIDRGYSSKPHNVLKHEIKSHDQDTKAALDSLLQDNFVVHEKLNDSDPAMCPVQLPVTSSLKKENKVNIKKIPKVKEELKDEDEAMIDDDQRTGLSSGLHDMTPEAGNPQTAAGLFTKATKSEQPQFMFIQLPDTLPGEPSTDDVQPSGSKKHTETELHKHQDKCTLADFHEGLIGKLCIHKSGRTTLRLSNIALDVQLGTYPGFLQDVVSLRVDGDTADLIVLGHVPHKVVCIPDFEAMIPET